MPEPQDFSAPSPVVTGDPDTARPADVQAGPVRSAECIPPNSESGPVPDPDPEPEAAVPANTSPPTEPALPPLPPQEFRIYNRLAEQMDYFHDHFRQIWHTLYIACTTGRRPSNLTLKQFLDEGLRLTRYLETHHAIEETHLYPLLARKMPEFGASSPPGLRKPSSSSSNSKGGSKRGKKGGEECELLRQHKEIHDGMDEFAEYLRRCKSGECELELGVLKEKMDSWGEVLFKHLDQEVEELGAEKMRRYWTVAEMRAFPI